MNREEKWEKFLKEKGWLANDIISGSENEVIRISIRKGFDLDKGKMLVFDTVMVLGDSGILCAEHPQGSIFFQWDDIIQIMVENEKSKKGWL